MQSVKFNLVAVGRQHRLLLLLLYHYLRQTTLDRFLFGVGLVATSLPSEVHLFATTACLGCLGRTFAAIVGSKDETTLALLRSNVSIPLGDEEDVAGLLGEALPPSCVVAFGQQVLLVLSVVVVVVLGCPHLCAAHRFGRRLLLVEKSH